jgi:hypothetical protein
VPRAPGRSGEVDHASELEWRATTAKYVRPEQSRRAACRRGVVPFRETVSLEERRVALDELRTAHRIVCANALPRIRGFGGIWDLIRMIAIAPMPVYDLDNTASELEHARAEVRSALVRVGGIARPDPDLPDLERANVPGMRRIVERMFDRIRDSDPRLHDVEPLATD